MMNNIKPPCYDRINKKDCPRRKPGCASTCKEWADYVKARDEVYEVRANDYLATDQYFTAAKQRRIDAYKKRSYGRIKSKKGRTKY